MTIQLSYKNTNTIGYQVTGYGIKLYCKLTEYGINTDQYKCTMSFGTGFKKFCLVAAYSVKKPYEIYIDRVENKDGCLLDGKLSDITDGTAKLVRIALWTMTKFYPHVTHYTLKDYSQIPCDGENSRDTLHLGYDYIIKYNEKNIVKNNKLIQYVSYYIILFF